MQECLRCWFEPLSRTEHGAPTREYSDEAVGMAPLHWAATEGRLRASAWLLGPGGADPEGRDNQVGGDGGFPVLVSRIMSNETVSMIRGPAGIPSNGDHVHGILPGACCLGGLFW